MDRTHSPIPSGHCMSEFLSEVIEMRVDEGQRDLLSPVTDEVDRSGEFPNLGRLRLLLESRGLTGPGGDIAPGFIEGFAAGLHLSAPLDSPATGSRDGHATVGPQPCARCGNGEPKSA